MTFSETVPQQEDFDVESRTDNVTVLRPKWAGEKKVSS